MSKLRDEWIKAKAAADKAGLKTKKLLEDKVKFGPLLDKFVAAEAGYEKGMKALATKPDTAKETALRKKALEAAVAAAQAGGQYGLALKAIQSGKEAEAKKPAATLSAALTRVLNVLIQAKVRYKV